MAIEQQVLSEMNEISGGLPLIITLLSRIYFEDRDEYDKIVNMMKGSSIAIDATTALLPNVDAIIAISVNRLRSDIKRKMIQLSVFKRVPIPITMIALLWRMPLHAVLTILREIQSKYLLTIYKKDQNR